MRHWKSDVLLTRRGLITLSAGLLVAKSSAAARVLTPAQTAGPFYPAQKPADADADLTRVRGRGTLAEGQIITVSGRLFSVRGPLLAGALVEIWQADAKGRYHHPSDIAKETRDLDFQGYGALRTRADGRFHFRTIKPRYYQTGTGPRTPHIHFRVTSASGRELVTQMYFPGEPMNRKDQVFRRLAGVAARDAATAAVRRDAPFDYHYDIVLA